MCRHVDGMKLEQYVDILRDMHKTGAEEELQDRLNCLVTTLVTQNIAHRDSLHGMYSHDITLVFSYF